MHTMILVRPGYHRLQVFSSQGKEQIKELSSRLKLFFPNERPLVWSDSGDAARESAKIIAAAFEVEFYSEEPRKAKLINSPGFIAGLKERLKETGDAHVVIMVSQNDHPLPVIQHFFGHERKAVLYAPSILGDANAAIFHGARKTIEIVC